MRQGIKSKTVMINCLTILALSTIFCCPKGFCDGFYDFAYIDKLQTEKLHSLIKLDTSNTTELTPKANTTIPFKMREFSESDYFTSVIDNSVPQQQNFAPKEQLQTASGEQPTSSKELMPLEEITSENGTYTPLPVANDFFSPVANSSENKTEENTTTAEQKEEIKPEVSQPALCEQPYEIIESDNIAIEGKPVSEIKITGLKSLTQDTILGLITTQTGTLFNQNLVQQDLQKIYSTGYFTDDMTVEPIEKPDGTISLTFNVKENIQVSKITFTGNTIYPSSELMQYVSQMTNKPQNLVEINKSIEGITKHYHENGYTLANVSSVDDSTDGGLNFTILEGVINKINIAGNERTKDYVIERNIMTQSGTIYNEECLKKDLAKVFSTNIFEEVNQTVSASEENEGTYDITVVVKEKATSSIGFGGGVDTGLGAFGSITFKEDNFLGRAQKLSLGGIIGSGVLLSDSSIKDHMNYQVELGFVEPHFLNADNSLMSKLYFREMGSWNIPLAIERRIGANIGVEHKVKGHKHLTTSLIGGVEHINLKEGDFTHISKMYNAHGLNIADRARQLDDGFFLNLSPGVRYSNLDSEENPREGVIAQARFTESFGITDFNKTNGRLSGAVTKFFPVFKKSSFSLTGKAGLKVHGDEMPEFMAYRLGGPYSIRGFRLNGVGTGESFLMGSAELATPLPFTDKLKWDFIKKMRLTFFVDAGKVFDPTITNVLFDRPEHAITAGIGLRMYVPGMGPISIDYGIPLTNPGINGSENGYFTFGAGGMNVYGYGY